MSGKKNISFEELLKRLEEITGKLEEGNISLEDSMKLYEEGVTLKQQCEKHLALAESKWTQLEKKGDASYSESNLDVGTLANDRIT